MSEQPHEPGSVAEEAAKLFEALTDWAKAHTGGVGPGGLGEGVATGGPECRLCPVCQFIGVLRSTRPETFDHLLDAAGSLAAALRTVVDAHERSWASRPHANVERIDVE